MIDQLQRRERQLRGAIALMIQKPIDDAFGVKPLKPIERERRTGTVAQQPLQAGSLLAAIGTSASSENPLFS
jgi:hypothetical protein